MDEQLDLFNKVRATSKDAYADIERSGKRETYAERIHTIIRLNPGITRLEISRRFGITINNTCGRVNSLVTNGSVEEIGEKKDVVTGKKGMKLYVPSK